MSFRRGRRYYSKINTGKPMYPYSFISYVGTFEVRYKCKSKEQARKKLANLLQIDSIGRLSTEGLGKVRWVGGEVRGETPATPVKTYPKIKIRRGLPHGLSQVAQDLIQYALLHDFFHTSKHRSKIYVEPELDDQELVDLVRKHHNNIDHPLVTKFRKYDTLAAMITRKIWSPRTNRYNWRSTKTINFEKLAKNIQEVANNIWKLYEYIYHSKELHQLNESLQFGHSSLRDHLVILANLIVQDAQKGNL